MASPTNLVKVRPWHIANTTIRSPLRLRGGLEALIAGGFEGNMGKAQEETIAIALDEAGVISLSPTTTDITTIARKWRHAFVKLGFLWPDTGMKPQISDVNQAEIGAAFTLTPNGRSLLASQSLESQQEVFLRSLTALHLPSPLEPGYGFASFSPLNHVIRILHALSEAGAEEYISRLEMASIVILTNGQDDIREISTRILQQRLQRAASNTKRRFDSQTISDIALANGQKPGTLYDYQDVTFRYLKATGLFQSRGRGIAMVPEKRKIARLLSESPDPQASPIEYLTTMAQGATLPTDNQDGATAVLADLMTIATEWQIEFDPSGYDLSTPKNVSIARHDLEAEIFAAKELRYAADQKNHIEEILTYLQMLDENRDRKVFGDSELVIPKEERPAYFEWLLWRVLLAINQLVVPPSSVRRFHVDQDFLPVGTAPGGGADVIAEYADSVLVVEVTLTENSRQEAAEGEPVRRHVADIQEAFESKGKAVYGLFVARRIDTNTAETFRIGVWYRRNDMRVSLDVVPLTISQLRGVLRKAVGGKKLGPSTLIDVIIQASSVREESGGAPEWKSRIAEIVGA